MTGPAFDRVQFRYLLEARVTLINKYMWYGGACRTILLEESCRWRCAER